MDDLYSIRIYIISFFASNLVWFDVVVVVLMQQNPSGRKRGGGGGRRTVHTSLSNHKISKDRVFLFSVVVVVDRWWWESLRFSS